MNTIINFMKRNYKILLVVVCLSVTLFAFKMNATKPSDPEKDKLLLELLTFVIEKGHYNPATIDDAFSKGIYKNYIEALDPSKRFFLQSDIDEFSKFELQLDDQLLNKDLTFFNLTYERLIKRMEESKKIYKDVLSKPFDYSVDESFNIDYEKAPYSKNVAELRDKWRKQIKLSTLSSLVDKQKLEEDKKKNDATYQIKPFEALEKETRESSVKSLDEYFGFIKELDRNDWFSVYINSITARFDPHTNYLAADDKARFDQDISGKLEGIGARLQKKNDLTEISELISGGPAWRGKQLEAGDLIMKVAQGNGEAVDVVGMRLDDVVKKIKGPKGSEVRLTVKKVDGTIKIISIIRDIVEIEETYAKSSIVNKNGLKYGVIYLPKFYIDFENKDGRDAGKDIALEVDRLKKSGVNGIILDVRDDGGGSLSTVVDIAGLFIEQGPIVQIKSAGRQKEVLYDRDKKIEWDGPLVIMVNSFSASASEILAAAIQDYKRGIIIGSKQTYGKGTVQNVIDLNQFVRSSSVGDLGAIKTTTQKFYRINGGSTQLEGVRSDIVMPDRYAYLKMGERDIDNAMPWDKIDQAVYSVWNNNANFNQAIANSKNRIGKNPQFQLIEENAKWIDSRSEENVYSLNIDKFKIAQADIEEKAKKYKPIVNYKNTLSFTSLPYETEVMSKDASLKEKREIWHESLSKDIYVEEAINVLDDLQPKSISKKDIPVKMKKDKLAKS
ncbi:carboxy terminal-processing peptidase [Flavobacterium sp. LB2P84]|uniref:Carboxy terminal-processing peptidase n=1 Tax=Flavobacterium yafengii TaxID=3041253 RepID=A0AAW6TIW5_9FLAO|nr:carboxy terminal-processing peptidase [Flavobacterium yafengii]MDI5898918.1 carboxy terminal-processing peptidase [Flavobacterium yafengii]MDI5948108.1 carboxy terminal-processing peptidase [Flavobacterium yafengii]MDI6033196.1 carboxy terminal-processing peptidase [Flavobacterium yafengii]MDI6047292.1 carboxy terminal-processing peptidase [Flavobacterium yafengii]